ncbi:MAG: ATP-binding protein [Halobacteriota archaeon]
MSSDTRLLGGAELVAGLGLVFLLGGVVLWGQTLLPETASLQNALYELVVHVLFGGVILGVGIHLERSELAASERWEVMLWCFGGFVFMLGLATWSELDAILAGELTVAFASNVVVFGSLGGAFGAIAGVNWGRARRNADLAAHNEEQRETLVLLTRLLRHDIRNDMAAIAGHVELLDEHVDPEGAGPLEVIRSRTESIVRLLGDTDTLVKTLGTDRDPEPVDLSTVLQDEITKIETDHEAVDVRSAVPSGLVIMADGLIHQLFSNLLQNAVSHNGPDDLVIDVRAEQYDGTVAVSIADNGVGIPDEFKESCFELGERGPGSDGDGIGLYLVSRLAEVYGGSVEVGDAPDGGARFDIELPAADSAPG